MSEGKDEKVRVDLKRRKIGNDPNPISLSTVEDADLSSPKEIHEPVDVAAVKWILESMGVTQYEPRVVPQLLEFVHRTTRYICLFVFMIYLLLGYTSEVLVDAHEYSKYANKLEIDTDDIRLAAMSRLNHNYAQIPSREVLL
jgi:transcription initiation factor TFIID subunit 9B